MSKPHRAPKCRTCIDPLYLGRTAPGDDYFKCPDCGKRFARRKESSEWLIGSLLRSDHDRETVELDEGRESAPDDE